MTAPVYLDHAATTPVRPEVVEVMLPFLTERFGNPSGVHHYAREAQRALDRARRDLAEVLGCRPADVVLTSGGTESVNAAVRGISLAQALAGVGRHVVTTAIEHHAVLHTCQYLEKFGFQVTYVPPDPEGLVLPDQVAAAVRQDTVLVSVMLANNEVGTILPVPEIVRAVRSRARALGRRIPVHTDAVQAPGLLPLSVDGLGVDALSLSAHKFGGPKGMGLLYLRKATPFLSQQTGGGQERQRRAGTENVAGAVGMATALRLAEAGRTAAVPRLTALRDRLIQGVLAAVPDARLNGHRRRRLANHASFSFAGVEGDRLIAQLDAAGIAASNGSACSSATWEPSHVLLALGLPLEWALGTVRFTLGPENTDADVDHVLAVLPRLVARLREHGGALPK
ncbi:MAG TPA: cysteine desulfurase family protein [Dehalococcoidia bacterium]